MKVEVYSKNNCQHCIKAKNLLNLRGIEFTTYMLQESPTQEIAEGDVPYTREDFFELFPNARSVPQIVIDGKAIGSYEQLVSFLDAS